MSGGSNAINQCPNTLLGDAMNSKPSFGVGREPAPSPARILAYLRVSTDEQVVSGLGLAHQRAVIEAEAARRDWRQVEYCVDDGFSARTLKRPAMAHALQALETGRGSVLVVAKLDRLSRSLLDFATLMDQAARQGWELLVLDLAIDTTTPSGQLMANVMASFAEYERRLISQRTRDALAQKRAQGIRLGRPRAVTEETIRRISEQRRCGHSLADIADELQRDGVPTAQGGRRWYGSTVAAILRSAAFDVRGPAPSSPSSIAPPDED
jgi:DNA invertase Pin-like site-specific DNA recombinase